MEIKGLIQELINKDTISDVAEVIEKLFSETENMNKGSHSEDERTEIEENAVSLWNWTVARKANPVMSDFQRVKLRHVACRLMMFYEVNDPPEEIVRRQILMAMKTGKGWVEVGEFALADELLEIAMNQLEKLYAQLTKRSTKPTDIPLHKADVEKNVFKVLSYQAESAIAQRDFQKAVMCVQRCKDILMRLPKETCYLSLLCYNFGVETYELKRYEESSFWLSQSYDIGKMDMKYSTGKEMQAKVLRLLATVYLEWDCIQYQDKALRALAMANEENLHPAGFFLKIKILLKGSASDEDVSAAVDELLHHGFSLDICLDTAKLLLEYEREAIGFDFLKSVAELFALSPDIGKVILLHIKLLLLRMREPLAKKLIEDVIAGQNTEIHLAPELLNDLQIILWERAARNYEAKSYSEALQWYNYSLNFYSMGKADHQNLAKLQRNVAACYLHLKELDKAREAVNEAESYDPNSIFTHFYMYKIAVLENNTPKAFDVLVGMEKLAAQLDHQTDKLLTDGSVVASLLTLAAQFALENNQQSVAIEALGYLSQHLQDCQQAFTALKCLIRLVLSQGEMKSREETTRDMETLLTHLTAAHQRLDGLFGEEHEIVEMRTCEAQWFRKTAWNLAIQCESCPRIMRDFFILSFKNYEDQVLVKAFKNTSPSFLVPSRRGRSHLCTLRMFSQFGLPEKANLLAQRTCLLMAAAVELDMGRSSSLPAEQQTELLVQALEHIQSCRDIWKVLKQTGDFPKDPTDTILLLYEFETRTKLNDPAAASLLDQALELSHVDIKTLETMASLAMESPAHYPSMCKRALKMVLTLLRKQDVMDTITFSKCLHSLVHLFLPSGMSETDVSAMREARGYFEEALSILSSTVLQASYPEVEILWLMTRAWNTGICNYCAGRYQDAEQWCALGMRFLPHLGTLKSSYEGQMVSLYSEVLEKLDRAKGFYPKEE